MLEEWNNKSVVSRTPTTNLNREHSIFNEKGGTRIDAAQSVHTIPASDEFETQANQCYNRAP